ncbi:unnamed protein product [Brassica oleracea]
MCILCFSSFMKNGTEKAKGLLSFFRFVSFSDTLRGCFELFCCCTLLTSSHHLFTPTTLSLFLSF